MKETHLVQQVIQYLNFKGHFVHRNNTGATRAGKHNERFIRFGYPGSSDIIGCSNDGRFIAVECKVGRNKTSPLQEAYLEEIRRRGGIGIVAYDLTDVESVL